MSVSRPGPGKRRAGSPPLPVLSSGMPRTLGVRLVSISKKRVVAEMPVKPMHLNRSLRVNGGAIMAFADVLGAAGTVINLPPGHRTTTLESKTNFFAAGEGPVMKAVSIPLHIGRTTMVWQTKVRNGGGRVVAIVTQTQMVIPVAPQAQGPARKAREAGGVRRKGMRKRSVRKKSVRKKP